MLLAAIACGPVLAQSAPPLPQPVAPASVPATLVVHLAGEIQIDAPFARLGEVAELSGPDELVALAAPLVVQELPGLGSRTLESGPVRALLRRAIGLADAQVHGSVRLRRGAITVGAADMVQVARADLAQRLAGVEQLRVSVQRPPQDQRLPAAEAELELVAEALTNRPWGEVPYRVRVLRDGVELARSLLVLHAAALRQETVAVRDLPRGHRLGLDDLATQELALVSGSAPDAPGPAELVGRELRRALRAGESLSLAHTRPPDLVRGGEQVSLILRGDTFALTGSGQAMASAALGERVRVRSLGGRIVSGIVRAAGEVEIER